MRTPFLAALLLGLALAGCSRKTETPQNTQSSRSAVTISAWIRLPARPDLPASGYFDAVANGRVGALRAISAGKARVEMHETMTHGTMSSMQPIGEAAFEQGRITFAPGGKHLMLYDLPAGLKPGGALPLAFSFQGLPPITVEANLVGPGDPEPDEWRLAR